jgi:hypothetical protein
MSKNILFVSSKVLMERTALHDNIDPKMLEMDIKTAQDQYILPLLGSELFKKIQSLLPTDINNAGNEDYKLLMDDYLIDALIQFTLSELPQTLTYQFWNKGVLTKSGDDQTTPTMSELVEFAQRFRKRGEMYANRCRNYLMSNPNTYPEYYKYGTSFDAVNPDRRSYTAPIFLGNSDDCCGPDGWIQQPYKP